MTAIIVLVVLFAALGVASLLGRTVDTRDPDYGLGRIIDGPLAPYGR
jgi:hypothetical protein